MTIVRSGLDQRVAQSRAASQLERRYLHVEDFVRALRLARDVADFVGGLGGQRGRGVAVDGGVAEWPEGRETVAEASRLRLDFRATYRGQTHREKASPAARRRLKKDKEKMSDYEIIEAITPHRPAGIKYKRKVEVLNCRQFFKKKSVLCQNPPQKTDKSKLGN